MSLAAACGWTLLRSLAVAALTTVICCLLRNELARLNRNRRLLLWLLLLVPFLTPGLITAYSYANFSLALVSHPRWNELRYDLFVALKLLAVGTAVMQFSSTALMSRAALHTARLAMRSSWPAWRKVLFMAQFWLRGPLRGALPAFAVLFLLVFQEFDIASFLGTTAWSVWLFDAHAKGLFLHESLRLSVLAVACEFAVIALVVACFLHNRTFVPARDELPPTARLAMRISLWLLAIGGCVLISGIPLLLVGRDTVSGLKMMVRNPAIVKEIAIASAFGVVGGVLATLIVAGVFKAAAGRTTPLGRQCGAAIAAIALLPGLFGSLVVSLAVLWFFQTGWLNSAYNTPIPAVIALIAFLLPRAALVQLIVSAARPREAMHLGNLLQNSTDPRQLQSGNALEWALHRRGQFFATCLVCVWGYWELAPIAILAPPGMTSAPVRLFNLMHYTRNDVLSAMTLTATLAPAAFVALLLAAHGLVAHMRR